MYLIPMNVMYLSLRPDTDLDLFREAPLAAGAVSRWRFDGSVEADDEDAAVAAAEQLGMCCSDADGVITCVRSKRDPVNKRVAKQQ